MREVSLSNDKCRCRFDIATSFIGSMRLDILVGGELIVELNSVPELSSLHVAQASSYLRASGLSLSLLLNFNVPVLTKGIRRVVLSPR